MNKQKNFNKYTKLFLAGLFIVAIFDAALVMSISIRSIIYFVEGKWFIPIIQFLPLTFFTTLFIFELKLIIKFYKNFKLIDKQSKERHIIAFDQTIEQNPKAYKTERIFLYLSCSLIVLFGGLGLIPLFFLLNGEKAHKQWKEQK
ncbi:hypothetical protein [Spiroplasma sp. BIUS-1]|uniref:hypothetical protein n=1 Tax=Spiroplasma sp. BIUS-1 TaxID=216964 RepID=UPI0013995271|nr:hypothetical protein [Spiroplasma sp. BIUS-1]QHX36687.1 hypothetical protein SBIUS_v1c04340 [Spiroplasma sp. BIUS-1]